MIHVLEFISYPLAQLGLATLGLVLSGLLTLVAAPRMKAPLDAFSKPNMQTLNRARSEANKPLLDHVIGSKRRRMIVGAIAAAGIVLPGLAGLAILRNTQHASAMDLLRKTHQDAMAEATNTHRQQTSALTGRHQRQIAEMRAAHDAELDALRKDQQIQSQFDSQEERMRDRDIQDAFEEYDDRIEDLEDDREELLEREEDLRKQLEEAQAYIARVSPTIALPPPVIDLPDDFKPEADDDWEAPELLTRP